MTDNQFDNFFREKLINHTAPVPEGLWEKIRPEKEKRPKGFFLRNLKGTGLFVAALLFGTLLFVLVKVPNTQSVPETAAGSLKANNKNASLKNAGISTQTEPKNSNQNTNDASLLNEEGKEKNEIISNQPDSRLVLSSTKHKASDNYRVPANKLFQFENKETSLLLPETQNNWNVSADKMEEAFNYNSANIQQASLFFLNQNINCKNGTVQKNLAANGHDKFIKSNIIVCPTNRARSNFNSDWSFELYTSPDYALKSVSNVSASQQYLDKKDSTERMQIGYSAGFRIVKPLNDNWLLKTGLQYSQINQKFSYRNENEIKTTTVITTRSIIRSPGDTVLVTDTSTLQQIGYSVKTIRNHYRSIDVPLTLGYQFGNEDLTIGINAGVIFNITSWYQGELLDTTLTSVPMSKISSSYYRSNIGMGLYSSISILKRINENTHLFFEPYFRYNLSNMTNTQSPYNQRFQMGGLAIGLRFDLNR